MLYYSHFNCSHHSTDHIGMYLNDGDEIEFNFIISGLRRKVKIRKKGNRLFLRFGYNKKLIAEVKTSFVGAKWHGFDDPPIKQWSIRDCQHNWFQIKFLAGMNPYKIYDRDLILDRPKRQGLKEYDHQIEMYRFGLTRRQCLIAGEMGIGKTLAAILIMEDSGVEDWLWVGPKSALVAVELEFIKWQCKIKPKFVTYAKLKSIVENWVEDEPVYGGIIFDESQKLKTPTSQRSQAAKYLADSVREEYGDDGYVILMSGSPAPKYPTDWWSQCEIACPGFLRENHINTLKQRLAIIQERESNITGGVYPHLVAWRDDENRCDICGEYEDSDNHDELARLEGYGHQYKKSINEVFKLSRRMDGLVLVKLKKDCLDLPDKIYRKIECTPSEETKRLAQLIMQTAGSAVKALTLLRELSDGFQYREEIVGSEKCGLCKGEKTIMQNVYIGPPKTMELLEDLGVDHSLYEDIEDAVIDPVQFPNMYKNMLDTCPACNGVGEQHTYERQVKEVACGKDQVLVDLLDEFDDVGRVVIYAGFTGSLDRICKIIRNEEWEFIRLDGRGWISSIEGSSTELLDIFQNQKEKYPRIAFIGHPASAGTGLTLTASPAIIYYSNDFNAESRIQSEDRIHRPGMDENRGATIIDIMNLASDEYVLENLRKKRNLQSLSLGELGKIEF